MAWAWGQLVVDQCGARETNMGLLGSGQSGTTDGDKGAGTRPSPKWGTALPPPLQHAFPGRVVTQLGGNLHAKPEQCHAAP